MSFALPAVISGPLAPRARMPRARDLVHSPRAVPHLGAFRTSAQHELLLGLSQYCFDAGLIFCQAGTPGRVGLPLALSLRLAQGMFLPPGQQSVIFGVSVPCCLPDSPDEVLKLTSRDVDSDPPVWVGPHLALVPGETQLMTELPVPGVLARAVLPQARPAAADGDL